MKSLKKYGRKLVCLILEWQVKRLRKKYKFKIVAVVGSVGKTSTKTAIAKILSSEKKVRFQEGNYNDRVTVPLVIFGHTNPSIFNFIAWAKIFWDNEMQIKDYYETEIVVVELGTDGPGQIEEFRYLEPEIAVVTAVKEEHMEFFVTLDAVAKEELTVVEFSERVIVNVDDVDEKYLKLGGVDHCIGVSLVKKVQYHGLLKDQKIKVTAENLDVLVNLSLLGKQGAKSALMAMAVASELEIKADKIKAEAEKLTPFNGRMSSLRGINNSLIIDDSYNASPVAVKAALDVLYSMNSVQKIAILGTMNELGDHSELAHKEIGDYCSSKKLDLLVTIGAEAEKFIALQAKKNGCKVESFMSPFDAGEHVASILQKGAVVLVKGSQNRVFAEESIKFLLENPKDKKRLVRQSEYWLKVKEQQFGRRID